MIWQFYKIIIITSKMYQWNIDISCFKIYGSEINRPRMYQMELLALRSIQCKGWCTIRSWMNWDMKVCDASMGRLEQKINRWH